MRVIDLQLYRSQRALKNLERKVSDVLENSQTGSVQQIKTCFNEYLRMHRVTK